MTIQMTTISFLLLSCPAMSSDQKPEPPGSAPVYSTPEAVYAASVAASEKSDARAAVHCIAPSAHADMAAYLAFHALIARRLSGKQPKLFADVLAVLDKHGLTEDATKMISRTDLKAAVKSLSTLIKKPTEFAIEMSIAQHEFAAKMGSGKKPKVTHKLANLKIDGNKATATVVMTLNEQLFEQPMAFVKVGEGWKMLPDFSSQPMNLRPKK
ncbi:MAG: hypothetical protein U0840_25355 [Gemmataceae bacterium]